MSVPNHYKTSLRAQEFDRETGSLKKITELLGRVATPNSITAASVQTENPGTGYTALATGAGHQIRGTNSTGTSLTFRRVGTTVTFPIASGGNIDLPCVANANEWEVKRTDDSNTQVTLPYLRMATV